MFLANYYASFNYTNNVVSLAPSTVNSWGQSVSPFVNPYTGFLSVDLANTNNSWTGGLNIGNPI
jgi:hypothetical protein